VHVFIAGYLLDILTFYMESEKSLQELSSLEPNDWNNIPAPIVKAVLVMKKCIAGQLFTVKENSEKVEQSVKMSEVMIKDLDSEIRSLKRTVISNNDILKQSLRELTETTASTSLSMQNTFSSEVEFIKKSTEGKTSYLEQQLKSLQSVVKTLPTSEDVEARIKASLRETSQMLRKDIRDDFKYNIFDPEMFKVAQNFTNVDLQMKGFSGYGNI
jgi:hypothetical protein